MSENM